MRDWTWRAKPGHWWRSRRKLLHGETCLIYINLNASCRGGKWWRDRRKVREHKREEKKRQSGETDRVRSRLLIWEEDGVIADTSTSCFPSCIIQVSNVLAVGRLTGQTAEDLSGCFVYVVRCSRDETPRRAMKREERSVWWHSRGTGNRDVTLQSSLPAPCWIGAW